jgi:hypothetical protein
MPFFPVAKSAIQCERLKIPLDWKDRLRGFIFFDSNFVNISNNKLKIKADPDFETWIHEKEIKRRITYNPKNVDKDFEKSVSSLSSLLSSFSKTCFGQHSNPLLLPSPLLIDGCNCVMKLMMMS